MLPSITTQDNAAMKANVQNDIRETKRDLQVAAGEAGHKVRKFVDTASTEISQATDAVKTHINDKPMQSSLIALGVGFVFGALLLRR